METTHKPLQLKQVKFGTVKRHGHIYKFYFNNYFA
jgi:hypothetical protein